MNPRTLGTMWADLLTSEMNAQRSQHEVTTRAKIYLEAGLELERVLNALRISRSTWYRRAAEQDAWREENTAAADRMLREADARADARAATNRQEPTTMIVVDGDDLDDDLEEDLPACTSPSLAHEWTMPSPYKTIQVCRSCGLHVKDDRESSSWCPPHKQDQSI